MGGRLGRLAHLPPIKDRAELVCRNAIAPAHADLQPDEEGSRREERSKGGTGWGRRKEAWETSEDTRKEDNAPTQIRRCPGVPRDRAPA